MVNVIRNIFNYIHTQLALWNEKKGVLKVASYDNLINAIKSVDNSFGVSNEITSHSSFDQHFISLLGTAIEEGIDFLSKTDTYGEETCKEQSIIYAPAKHVDTNLRSCFAGCASLVFIDKLTSPNLKDCRTAFYGCSMLTSVDLSGLNLKNVSMSQMFRGCHSLTRVDFSVTNFSCTSDIEGLFRESYGIQYVDFTGTEGIINTISIRLLFGYCRELIEVKGLHIGSSRNTFIAETAFVDCHKLSSFEGCVFDFTNASNLASVFGNCYMLGSDNRKIDLVSTHNSTTMKLMFGNLSSRNNINPITEITGISICNVPSNSEPTSGTTNIIHRMIEGSKITRIIFSGDNSVRFDCMFHTQSWQNLDLDSIISFIDNCLADCSEDTNSHIFRVSASMKTQLQNNTSEEWELPYSDVLAVMGWDLQ